MYIVSKEKLIEVCECDKFLKRLIGFMFKKDEIKVGKRFPRCNSIHTFMMKQNIDLIMTDKNNKVVYMYPNLSKNKIILPKKRVYYTYELPIGTCIDYEIGDKLEIK